MILGPDGKPVAEAQRECGREQLAEINDRARDVEVIRSFSFKLNLGNYESADFFCSQRAACPAEDAESVSADLYEFCLDEVMKAVKDLKERRARKEAERARRSAA